MKAKVLILFLVGLSLGMVLACLQAEEVSVTTVITPASQAQIIEAGGTIRVDGADVVVGTALEVGNVVEAVNYTILKINPEATNVVRMEAGSRLRIDNFFPGDAGVSEIYVFQGSKVYGLIEELPSGSDFVVETPTAVVGVRGTEFSVEVGSALPYPTSLEVFEVSPGHSVDITEKSAKLIIREGTKLAKNLFQYFRQGVWPITTAEAATATLGRKTKVEAAGEPPVDDGPADQGAWDARKGGVQAAARKARGGLIQPVIEVTGEGAGAMQILGVEPEPEPGVDIEGVEPEDDDDDTTTLRRRCGQAFSWR